MRTTLFPAAAFAALLLIAPGLSFAGIIHGPVIHPVTNHRYYLLSNANWYDSQLEATGLNGNLVTINDAEENQWVVDNFSNVQGVLRQLWIGLNDNVTEGTFAWASGEPVNYVNWKSGEPSGGPEDDDAVQLFPSPGANAGQWNDTARTSAFLHGVVELPAANPPTITTGRVTVTSPTSVVLHGVFLRNGGETFAGFEIGLTIEYGTSLGAVPNIGETHGASTVALGISDLIPGTKYHYRAVAGNSVGIALGEDRTFTAGNNPPFASDDFYTLPLGFGPFPLRMLDNDSDTEQDPFTITAVTQGAHGSVVIIDDNTRVSYQLTDSTYIGEDSFTYTISDGFASVTAKVTVTIPMRDPVTSVVFAKGSPVPGAGVDPRIPAGAKFTSFGLPSINYVGDLAFLAQYRSSSGRRSVIVRSQTSAGSSVVVQTGDPVPDEEGVLFPFSFARFKDPLFNNEGLVGFLARFSGPGINSRNDTGVFTESTSRQLRLIAREGDAAPGADGATFKTFVSVAMGQVVQESPDESPRHVVAFVAQLNSQTGKVTSANDTGLWIYRSAFFADSSLQLILREGSPLDLDPTDADPGKTVRSFVALQPLPGAAGQGHGVGLREGSRVTVMAKAVFEDATQAIVEFNAAGEPRKVKATGDPSNLNLTFNAFGTPIQSATGQQSYLATLVSEAELPPINPVQGVFASNDPDSIHAFPQAFSGDPLPDRPQASFQSFINLVTSSISPCAFTSQVSGPGINRANDTEIWWTGLGGISLLFQEGSAAPGVDGGKFRDFLSLAMPESGNPLLKARISRGRAGVTDGLWYVDQGDAVRLYQLQGERLPEADNRPVRKIRILENVPSSPTQPRSHNSQGQIVFRADFRDGSQAIIRAQLP